MPIDGSGSKNYATLLSDTHSMISSLLWGSEQMGRIFEDWAPAQAEDPIRVGGTDECLACLKTALASDNPTVLAALNQLYVVVRLAEPELYEEKLMNTSLQTWIAQSHAKRFDPSRVHQMVDHVLAGDDCHAMFALEKFCLVARQFGKLTSIA